jgi:hypothetical protein
MNEVLEHLGRVEARLSDILLRLNQLEGKSAEKPWWSPEYLAASLHRKPFTVREWCRLGRIHAEKDKYSRLWRVSDKEAQRLIAGGGLQPNCAGRL